MEKSRNKRAISSESRDKRESYVRILAHGAARYQVAILGKEELVFMLITVNVN